MRILGLDFGSKTVGVAVSDGLLLTAQGVETIERKDENKLRKTCARIEELIAEYEITEIVLGLPKNMRKAAQTAALGKPFLVDVGVFGKNRYFVYVAAFGAFTEVSYSTPQETKNILGHQAYMLEAIKPYGSTDEQSFIDLICNFIRGSRIGAQYQEMTAIPQPQTTTSSRQPAFSRIPWEQLKNLLSKEQQNQLENAMLMMQAIHEFS